MSQLISFEQPTAAVVHGARGLVYGAGAALERDRNRRLRELRQRGREAIDALRALASIRMDASVEIRQGTQHEEVAERDEQTETYRAWLGEVREAMEHLEGPDHHALERALARHARDLFAELAQVYPLAMKSARDVRAVLSFMAGEHDHIDMGYDFIPQPTPEEARALRGPSTPLEDFLREAG